MTEPLSAERDRAGILQCRACVADAHANVALIDEIVSRAELLLPYAGAVHQARLGLEGALGKLDEAVAEVIAVVQGHPAEATGLETESRRRSPDVATLNRRSPAMTASMDVIVLDGSSRFEWR